MPEKKVEKKNRVFNVKDLKELKIYSEVLNKAKIRFVVTGFIAKDGTPTIRFTTDPITEEKRVKVVTDVRIAIDSQ